MIKYKLLCLRFNVHLNLVLTYFSSLMIYYYPLCNWSNWSVFCSFYIAVLLPSLHLCISCLPYLEGTPSLPPSFKIPSFLQSSAQMPNELKRSMSCMTLGGYKLHEDRCLVLCKQCICLLYTAST